MTTEYLTTDNIAIFVATLALVISILQHWNTIKDKKVLLAVSYKKHPQYDENIIEMKKEAVAWENISIVPLYVVTIRNIGNVPAFISEIFGISSDSVKHDALTRANDFMTKVSHDEVSPKASKEFKIYFHEENTVFDLKECIVVDGTGKQWKGFYNG